MRALSRSSVSVFLVALTTVACARLGAGPGSDGGIDHPTGSGQIVLRVHTGGGFVPVEYLLTEIPEFTLTGDGRIVTVGPQIAIYPGPALPNLLVRTVTEEGMQAILARARDAGLSGPGRHYDLPVVADAPTTTFVLVVEGERHETSAYALGFEEQIPDEGAGGAPPGESEGESSPEVESPEAPAVEPGFPLSEEERRARAALAAYRNLLFDLERWLPQGSLGPERPFDFEELRIFVGPWTGEPEPGLEQEPKRWPLAQPLAAFGSEVSDRDLRCGTVSGEELEQLLPSVQQANQLTPWVSEGREYRLLLRPLLPDESGC